MNLYIGNISYRLSDEDLAEAFGEFGEPSGGAWYINEPWGRLRDLVMVPKSHLHVAKVVPDRFENFHF